MKPSEIEKILKQIQERQKRILKEIGTIKKDSESRRTKMLAEVKLTPALVRALKGLLTMKKPVSSSQLGKHLGVSRNLASVYLDKLVRGRFVAKKFNLNPELNAKYVYEVHMDTIPEHVQNMLRGER